MAHVLPHHRLVERVVTRRNRGMCCEKRSAANHFVGLVERQPLVLHEVFHTLDAYERRVALVAVIHLLMNAESVEGADAAQSPAASPA